MVESEAAKASDILSALSQFSQLKTSYKSVADHQILAHVLIPNNTSNAGEAPLVVRFHGGGLITGSALFADWLAPWNFRWAHSLGAVVVLPDYRLLPESSGADILDDLSDFWKWISTDLQNYIDSNDPKPIKVDLKRTIAMGESAGGYMAIQSGFLAPSLSPTINIRGIIAPYPMLDLEDPWYTIPGHRSAEKFIGINAFPESLVTNHLTKIRANNPILPISTSDPPARIELMVAAFQHGLFHSFLQGNDPDIKREIYPLRRLDMEQLICFPPLLIPHGLKDGAVPHEGSEKFADALRRAVPDAEVRLELHEGDHGFDSGLDFRGKGWLRDALTWFEEKSLIRT